jgi:hypothetical protein
MLLWVVMFGFFSRLTAFVAPISLHINKEGASFAKKNFSFEKKLFYRCIESMISEKSYLASEIFSLHDIRCLRFAHTIIFVGSSSQLDPPLHAAHPRPLPVSRHHELGAPPVKFRELGVPSAGRREL